jgi:N-acetylated-alpha-linked acidic dipeptidase
VFGVLLENGWKPRRSIILASWDANEYGNVGSTEWVEDNLHWLDKDAIAYLNVDHAVTGPHFSVQASPLLQRLLIDVMSMVIDPRTSASVFFSWLKRHDGSALIPPIGTTTKLDSVAFFEHAGIASLSMSFDGDDYGVSHSTFDR